MKKGKWLMLTVFAGLILAAGPAISQGTNRGNSHSGSNRGEIISEVSPRELERIMEDEGYNVDVNRDGSIQWTMEIGRGEFSALIFISDDNESIQFWTYFTSDQTSLRDVNRWNQKRRFSRSYLDDDNDPILEMDKDLEGGVTRENLVNFFDLCEASFIAWGIELTSH